MIVMKLNELPFEQIRSGKKIWEVRLNDEKRQKIKIGDSILFRKNPDLFDGLVARVVDIKHFDTFKDMACTLSMEQLGFERGDTFQTCVDCYHTYYSVDEENKYGVVAFKLEVIK